MPPPPNSNLGYTAAIRLVPSVVAVRVRHRRGSRRCSRRFRPRGACRASRSSTRSARTSDRAVASTRQRARAVAAQRQLNPARSGMSARGMRSRRESPTTTHTIGLQWSNVGSLSPDVPRPSGLADDPIAVERGAHRVRVYAPRWNCSTRATRGAAISCRAAPRDLGPHAHRHGARIGGRHAHVALRRSRPPARRRELRRGDRRRPLAGPRRVRARPVRGGAARALQGGDRGALRPRARHRARATRRSPTCSSRSTPGTSRSTVGGSGSRSLRRGGSARACSRRRCCCGWRSPRSNGACGSGTSVRRRGRTGRSGARLPDLRRGISRGSRPTPA